MRKSHLVTCVGVCLGLLGVSCKSREFNVNRFNEVKKGPDGVFTTDLVPFHAMQWVPQSKIQVTTTSDPDAPGEKSNVRVSFQGLDAKEVEALKEHYGRFSQAKSLVEAGAASYELSDFLPPLFQALEGYTFTQLYEMVSVPLKGLPYVNTVHTSINCWSTAWELTRIAKTKAPAPPSADGSDALSFAVFGVSGSEILPLFRDDATTSHLQWRKTSSPDDLSPLWWDERNAKPVAGDLLLVSHLHPDGKETVEHVAIFLDHDMYFEKTAMNSDAPIRVTSFGAIVNRFRGRDGKNTHLEWRRPTDSPLPHPREAFASSHGKTDFGMEYLRDANSDKTIHQLRPLWIPAPATGRARLPDAFLQRDAFRMSAYPGAPSQ